MPPWQAGFAFFGGNEPMHAVRWLASPRQGKSSQREGNALFDDFCYFWSRKSTIKEKFLYDSSLSEFFSLVRKERKGQKEEGIPLLISFCRLAATGANTLPRPSDYSIAAATGSKRSSADSDSLLCHVRLWQTSRFRFGCASVCEHSEIKFALHNTHVTPHPPLSRSPFSHWRRLIVTSVSAGIRPTPAMHFQRACRQCVHESARFSRALCSHAW